MTSYFVTATDTNAGKTMFTTAFIKLLRLQGIDAVPYKPIQTGGLEDTDFTLEHNKISGKKEDFYTYAFEKPCSPHLASALEEIDISINKIADDFNELANNHESVIVEGIGGVMVPIGNGKFLLDVITELQLPVILVIANKIGSINQSLLTIDKLTSVGFCPEILVFNDVAQADETILYNNVLTVKELTGINKAIRIPYIPEPNLDDIVRILSIGDTFESSFR